jgi:hypothetical protein
MGVTITPERKHSIFKALATKPLYEVGIDFGLDKYYADRNAIRQAVNRIYNEVLVNHEDFGISDEVVTMVKDAMASRKSIPNRKPVAPEFEKLSPIDPNDITGLLKQGRDKAAVLLHKKMDILAKSPKKLEKESIVNLAKVLGIMFDKSQIIQGEATEHIAVLAKVDDKLTPEQQMEMLVKMREKTVADKFTG